MTDNYTVTMQVHVPDGTPEQHVQNTADYFAMIVETAGAEAGGDWSATVGRVTPEAGA